MTAVDTTSRRAMIAGLSAVAGLSVGGCLGDAGQRLTLGVGPVDSRSHRAGRALAVAADRHSETLRLTTTEIDGRTERLYALDRGTVDAAGLDNTTLYRAAEGVGAFAAEPVESLPHQGFGYGWRDHYWLATSDIESTAALVNVDDAGAGDAGVSNASVNETSAGDASAVYPGQPGRPGRLVTEQLLRAAGRWETLPVDNRPREVVAAAVDRGEIGAVAVVETDGRLADWCRRLDETAGDRLAAVPIGEAFAGVIDAASNAMATAVAPTGWSGASLPEQVDGWRVASQWLFDPAVDGAAVAELRALAREHADLVDAPAAAEAAVAGAVMPSLPVHEGVADAVEGA
ncbi:hypothetical protein [Halohasta salina]|uniref:hypothetical protein n=1 Tax=Halohasta salina TaxID=2961621 RepID=UPI0020A23507|nr:hypothetical protein [Halohasta salina]